MSAPAMPAVDGFGHAHKRRRLRNRGPRSSFSISATALGRTFRICDYARRARGALRRGSACLVRASAPARSAVRRSARARLGSHAGLAPVGIARRVERRERSARHHGRDCAAAAVASRGRALQPAQSRRRDRRALGGAADRHAAGAARDRRACLRARAREAESRPRSAVARAARRDAAVGRTAASESARRRQCASASSPCRCCSGACWPSRSTRRSCSRSSRISPSIATDERRRCRSPFSNWLDAGAAVRRAHRISVAIRCPARV